MNIDPKDDSLWVQLPPIAKRNARQQFTLRAAQLYGLTRLVTMGNLSHQGVEKQFHEIMQSYPLPPNAFTYRPQRAELLPHIVTARLRGKHLPRPAKDFA